MATYQFCVHLRSEVSEEEFIVRVKTGTIDPGKEAARAFAMYRMKRSNTVEMKANDYPSRDRCPNAKPTVTEITSNASLRQWEKLGSAVASGDVASAGAAAADIVVGHVSTGLGALKKAGRWFRKRFGW